MMAVTGSTEWDDPLPESLHDKWISWVNSLDHLERLRVPRMYSSISFEDASKREILVFSDASKDIVAAVAYLKLYDVNSSSVSFLLGKAKVAPVHGHTIPRLELCAAVLATEIAETVRDQLDIPEEGFHFFTDSQVVLGYISNESRRFFIYVSNRVGRIRRISKPSQWNFIQSEHNPADVATRVVDAAKLPFTEWILGPDMQVVPSKSTNYDLVEPDQDLEIRPEVQCNTLEYTEMKETFSERFSRFSNWNRLVNSVSRIKYAASRFKKDKSDMPDGPCNPEFLRRCECAIIAAVQGDMFENEIDCISNKKSLPHSSSIRSLCPILGSDGLLRVGGRLNKISDDIMDVKMRNPIILPKNHH